MPNTADINQLIKNTFPHSKITVTDDSANHVGHASAPAGGGSHFTVRVVDVAFQGMSKVALHRQIYAVLEPLFAAGLHALAIEALTPNEACKKNDS